MARFGQDGSPHPLRIGRWEARYLAPPKVLRPGSKSVIGPTGRCEGPQASEKLPQFGHSTTLDSIAERAIDANFERAPEQRVAEARPRTRASRYCSGR